MQTPKLGVVIPHFNQWETFPESLESLFKSGVSKKVVVVDDDSDPGVQYAPGPLTLKSRRRDEITLVKLTPNQGVQFARNMGYYALGRHGCEYTLFSDSDVIWEPGALDKLVDALERSGEAYAYCDFGKGSLGTWVSGEWDEKRLRASNYISTMSVIATEVLEACGDHPFDENIKRLQDWDLWLSLLSKGFRGTYVPEVLFHTEFSAPGISMGSDYQDAVNAVREKHGL